MMKSIINISNKRYAIKIVGGVKQGDASNTLYYRNDMTFDLITKWKWYFEYRAALIQVQNPKWYVRLRIVGYDYLPPLEQQLNKAKEEVTTCKRMITKTKNAIQGAKERWNLLFPIEQEEFFKNALLKLQKYQERKRNAEVELNKIIKKYQ